jgi:biotin synthase
MCNMEKRQDILGWLREEDPDRLEVLWQAADDTRKRHVGEAVHLRGLVEISNHCIRECGYCGLRRSHRNLSRYRMTQEDILECARKAVRYGYGTVVLQAGEDYGLSTEWVAELVLLIKEHTPLAVTLSLGERPDEDLATWRAAGADRYLLRFETSDPRLYEKIHPSLPGRRSDRFAILGTLRRLGYEVGSGVMIGIPGQTYESLADDIETFRALDLDMIGCGPYIEHPATPLGLGLPGKGIASRVQVPNSEQMTYKVLALTRLVRPDANIPSTTALATLNKESGREQGLMRGANVVMPNLTPIQYRSLYEIYPGKACINETAEQCNLCLTGRIESIGRQVGKGPGGRDRPTGSGL